MVVVDYTTIYSINNDYENDSTISSIDHGLTITHIVQGMDE